MNANDSDKRPHGGRGPAGSAAPRPRQAGQEEPAHAGDAAGRQRHPALRGHDPRDPVARKDPRNLAAYAGVQRGAYGRYDEDDWQAQSHAPGYGDYEAERRQATADAERGWQAPAPAGYSGHYTGRGRQTAPAADYPGRYGGGYGPYTEAPPHDRPGYAEAISGEPGAGAYGRPRGRPGEDFRGRGPRGYVRSDERVREDVSERLSDDPYIDASTIDVVVHNGVVTLSGSIAQRRLKHRAEDLAESCRGVREIDNRLRVAPYPETGPVENT